MQSAHRSRYVNSSEKRAVNTGAPEHVLLKIPSQTQNEAIDFFAAPPVMEFPRLICLDLRHGRSGPFLVCREHVKWGTRQHCRHGRSGPFLRANTNNAVPDDIFGLTRGGVDQGR